MISRPKRRVPVSKAVGGGGFSRLLAMRPMAVLLAVRRTSARAEPLTTELPRNSAPGASVSQSPRSGSASAVGRRSTG